MSHLALARLYRPKQFSDIIGQEHTVTAISNSLDHNKLHHAYLLTGTRGVGKTTIARILAKALNCEQGISSHPCEQCDHCHEVTAGKFIDLIEIDAASRTKVEDTRELLDNISYAPSKGRYKVYLIDEVHMLSNHSFNALLKTLEEPPAHVIFILATTELDKLPTTVLSRCLQFKLLHLSIEQITQQLKLILNKEGITYEAESLPIIAEKAQGSMRDALSLLEQCIAYSPEQIKTSDLYRFLGITDKQNLIELLNLIANHHTSELLQHCAKLSQQNPNYQQILQQMSQLIYKACHAIATNAALDNDLQWAQSLSPIDCHTLYDVFTHSSTELIHAPTLQIGFEMALMRACAFTLLNHEPTLEHAIVDNNADSSSKKTNPSDATIAAPTPDKTNTDTNITSDVKIKKKLTLPLSNWNDIINQLQLAPATHQIAKNCTLGQQSDRHIQLILSNKYHALLNNKQLSILQTAISDLLEHPISLDISCMTQQNKTPAEQESSQNKADLSKKSQAFNQNPEVQNVIKHFNGQIDTIE